MPPTIEGVKQAHGFFFIVCGAGLDDRTDKHFQQSAAHSIDDDGNQNAQKGIRQQVRQYRKGKQTGSRTDMRQNDGCPIADFIDESGRYQVHQQLNDEIDRDEGCNLCKRYPIAGLKGNKQKRNKIVHNCLHNVSDEAGVHGLLIIRFHLSSPRLFIW